MLRFLVYFVLLILFTIFLWSNMDNKASLTLLGKDIFQDVPVLIIILASMFLGMLLMLPFQFFSRLRLSRRFKSAAASAPKKPDRAEPPAAGSGE
jgi:uncharacterized integral membrane protein